MVRALLRRFALEDFTSGLPREQLSESEQCLIGLRIRFHVVVERSRNRFSRRWPRIRLPSSSTHDNPALTSNDDLLLMNQLEACRGGHGGPGPSLRTERLSVRTITDLVIAYRAAEPEDVRNAML